MKPTKTKILKSSIGILFILTLIVAVFNSCNNSTDNVYKVDSSKCTACKKCIAVCPEDAISLVDGKAFINSQKCVGCGRCYNTCPSGAISRSSD